MRNSTEKNHRKTQQQKKNNNNNKAESYKKALHNICHISAVEYTDTQMAKSRIMTGATEQTTV